ncbi:TetR/AcrR family transcriptional regulator [Amphritea balenae]|uniref:TetR/AcrR family transcriptional regulator n=1 Tax=Amphritea balenae TaxID=452629 RepID=A0A3P1STK4_9GAMM|nr:TetR/AcrR family transcriptional regulator [Amphritea balenae]RRD00410.1 TetR/AcrR family transcriptional regulator [Amphritea balenae]GGK71048.1 transcriptional regulator [Amphritea balenae]
MSPRQVDLQTLHNREQILLDAAMDLIMKQGVEGLTMDKLVREVPYSKGTVYGHFSGKEDLLLAICNRGMDLLGGLFERARQFEGTSRERILAIHFSYLLYSRLYPMMFMLVITAKSPGVTEKASDRQREEHRQLEAKISGGIIAVIEQALADRECENPYQLTSEQIAFSNWSTAFGSISLLSKDFEQCSVRAQLDSEQALLNNINLLLDGLHWRPLFSEFDYNLTLQRFRSEIFAVEVEMLRAKGVELQPN